MERAWLRACWRRAAELRLPDCEREELPDLALERAAPDFERALLDLALLLLDFERALPPDLARELLPEPDDAARELDDFARDPLEREPEPPDLEPLDFEPLDFRCPLRLSAMSALPHWKTSEGSLSHAERAGDYWVV